MATTGAQMWLMLVDEPPNYLAQGKNMKVKLMNHFTRLIKSIIFYLQWKIFKIDSTYC